VRRARLRQAGGAAFRSVRMDALTSALYWPYQIGENRSGVSTEPVRASAPGGASRAPSLKGFCLANQASRSQSSAHEASLKKLLRVCIQNGRAARGAMTSKVDP